MKTTILSLLVVMALSFSGTVFAAAQAGGKAQPAEAKPLPASAVPPAAAAKPATPAQAPEHALKPSTPAKSATTKPGRAKNLDLRHCLDLETNAAIAKCAGE